MGNKFQDMGAGRRRIQALIAPPEATMEQKRRNVIGSAQGGNILVFPLDLSSHYMALQFYRYFFHKDSKPERRLHKTILLPVPLQLVEAINVSYNEASLGPIGGAMSDLLAQGNLATIGQAAGNAMDTIKDVAGAAVDAVGSRSILEMLESQRNNLGIVSMGFRGGDSALAAGLNRFFATAPNPHITALFQGVGLKQHQFQWKLAPASHAESHGLGRIINSLRASMLPARGKGNLTLEYPDECDIYIMGTNAHYMYHFKTAVIKSMSTNFAPDGVLSFFGGTGAPTAVTLDIQLTETSIHTREDYEPLDFVGAKDFSDDVYVDELNREIEKGKPATVLNKFNPEFFNRNK